MRLRNFSMAGAVALVGVGLIAHSAALVVSSFGNSAQAGVVAAAPAVASAAMAQGGASPTVVWYGTYGGFYGSFVAGAIVRAWSDGRIEFKKLRYFSAGDACGNTSEPCSSPWIVISNPNDGLAAFADLNSDAKVDGIDLAQVLSNWGDAPRNDIPPADCPLNLVNP
jgi:hypothetical protein